jgi:hypothetical protein
MTGVEHPTSNQVSKSLMWFLSVGLAATMLIAGAIVIATPRTGAAKPEFAGQTGFPCGQCHVNAAGGGKLSKFGREWKSTNKK